MRLILELPEDFPGAGATLELRDPRPRACDAAGWLLEVLDGGQPPGTARVLAHRRGRTTCGWEVELFDTLVAGERRLVAVYHFLHTDAVAAIRGTIPGNAAEVLATGRPDFGEPEIVALAQLWEG